MKPAIIATCAASMIAGLLYSHGQSKPKTNAPTLTVQVGQPTLVTFSNVISAKLHEQNCYLIRYVEGGITNEFHAWMVPIKLNTNR